MENASAPQISQTPRFRFFHADNCNRQITGKSKQDYEFKPYMMAGGSWCGIFATCDPLQIADLELLVATRFSAITELDEKTFNERAAQATGGATAFYNPYSYMTSLSKHVPKPDIATDALKGDGKVKIVDGPPAVPIAEVDATPLESVEDALKVTNVSSPDNSEPNPNHKAE